MQIDINGKIILVQAGQTVLEAATEEGTGFPPCATTRGWNPTEHAGSAWWRSPPETVVKLVASCTLPVSDGLMVETDTPRVRQVREMIMQLHLAVAPNAPRVQELARRLGVGKPLLVRHGDGQCTLCGLCVRACRQVGSNAIGFAFRGARRQATAPFGAQAADCLGCQACAEICPTGEVAFSETGGRLLGKPWQSDVPMSICEVCGRTFAPQRMSGHLQQRYGLELQHSGPLSRMSPEAGRKQVGHRGRPILMRITLASGLLMKRQSLYTPRLSLFIILSIRRPPGKRLTLPERISRRSALRDQRDSAL